MTRQVIALWWANRPLATKGLVVAAVPLLIFLGSVAALYAISRMEARAEQDVRLTIAIQNDVNEVHALLAEASSGARRYLLTAEPRFLEPYERAEVLVPQVNARLRSAVRDAEAASHAVQADQASIQQILRARRHLLALIVKVLDIARIEAGKLGLSIAPISIETIIAEAIGLSLPEAESRGIKIGSKAGNLAPVAADARRLLQVLLNLLSNAIKYNRHGGMVAVRARNAGGRVRVEVIDSGIGIEPGQAGQLFQPFTRLAAGAARTEGTGLGLSLSRALVEAMGGEIGYLPRDDGRGGACF